MISMLAYFSITRNIDIEYVLPERGHSFLPPDRCFSLVEREMRKKEIMYKEKEWEKIHSHYGNTIRVNKQVDVKDWSAVTKKYIKNLKELQISKIKRFIFTPECLKVATDYESEEIEFKLNEMKNDIHNLNMETKKYQFSDSVDKKKDVLKSLRILNADKDENVLEFYNVK